MVDMWTVMLMRLQDLCKSCIGFLLFHFISFYCDLNRIGCHRNTRMGRRSKTNNRYRYMSWLENRPNVFSICRFLCASQLQAIDARRVFPCFDEPAMKAIFNVSIIHPTGTEPNKRNAGPPNYQCSFTVDKTITEIAEINCNCESN